MSVQLWIGGDTVPTPSSREAFIAGDPAALLSEGLLPLWQAAEVRIVNLETPLCDVPSPIEKCGPALMAPRACGKGLAGLGIAAASLCNNHILDQGGAGLAETKAALAENGVACFGAGETAKEADCAYSFPCGGRRVTVYALCEHEYSVAGAASPGANGFDPLELADRVRALRQGCDYLIILYHGGREYDPYPSPLLQKRCRKMADCGADLILCQHSHCVGCVEEYGRAVIVYGQGNFLFDLPGEPAAFDTGLLVGVDFLKERPEVTYLPVGRLGRGAGLLTGDPAEKLLSGFTARSREIARPGFVEERYRAYAADAREKLLKVFLSGNVLLRGINLLYGRRPSRVYGRETLLAIRNSLECESINELIIEGLR